MGIDIVFGNLSDERAPTLETLELGKLFKILSGPHKNRIFMRCGLQAISQPSPGDVIVMDPSTGDTFSGWNHWKNMRVLPLSPTNTLGVEVDTL